MASVYGILLNIKSSAGALPCGAYFYLAETMNSNGAKLNS